MYHWGRLGSVSLQISTAAVLRDHGGGPDALERCSGYRGFSLSCPFHYVSLTALAGFHQAPIFFFSLCFVCTRFDNLKVHRNISVWFPGADTPAGFSLLSSVPGTSKWGMMNAKLFLLYLLHKSCPGREILCSDEGTKCILKGKYLSDTWDTWTVLATQTLYNLNAQKHGLGRNWRVVPNWFCAERK